MVMKPMAWRFTALRGRGLNRAEPEGASRRVWLWRAQAVAWADSRCTARCRVHRQSEYKAAWAGGPLRKADRWFPRSQTGCPCDDRRRACFGCTRVDVRLRGVFLDRALNAARKIRDCEDRAGSRPAAACGVRVRPAAAPAGSCEAGTASRVRPLRSFRIAGAGIR